MKSAIWTVAALGGSLALGLVGCGGTESAPDSSTEVAVSPISSEAPAASDPAVERSPFFPGLPPGKDPGSYFYVQSCDVPGSVGTVCKLHPLPNDCHGQLCQILYGMQPVLCARLGSSENEAECGRVAVQRCGKVVLPMDARCQR